MSTYSTWREVQEKTEREVVPEGEYAPSRIPLEINNPRPINEIGNNSRYKYNHSIMRYEVPISVIGGRPPFTFSVTGIATISSGSPAWNPGMTSYAVVRISAGVSGQYTVTVKDIDNNTVSVTVNVTVDDDKFKFIDSSAPNGGSGSISNPLNSMDDWYGSYGSISPYVGDIMVYRAGTYAVPVDGTASTIYLTPAKPLAHIGYPGETAVIQNNRLSGAGRKGFDNNLGGSDNDLHDMFWGNLTLEGGASWFRLLWSNYRNVYWKCKFDGMRLNTWGDNSYSNIGGIIYLNGDHQRISILDIDFEDVPAFNLTSNNTACLEFYNTSWCAIDDIRYKDVKCGHPSYVKARNQQICITSEDYWEANGNWPQRGALYHPNSYDRSSNDFRPVNIGIPVKDMARQIRYGRYVGNGQDASILLLDDRAGQDYGDCYLDRCVTANGWAGREPSTTYGGLVTVQSCSAYATPKWGDPDAVFPPEYNVVGCTLGTVNQAYIDLEAATAKIRNQQYKYTRGWEVPA